MLACCLQAPPAAARGRRDARQPRHPGAPDAQRPGRPGRRRRARALGRERARQGAVGRAVARGRDHPRPERQARAAQVAVGRRVHQGALAGGGGARGGGRQRVRDLGVGQVLRVQRQLRGLGQPRGPRAGLRELDRRHRGQLRRAGLPVPRARQPAGRRRGGHQRQGQLRPDRHLAQAALVHGQQVRPGHRAAHGRAAAVAAGLERARPGPHQQLRGAPHHGVRRARRRDAGRVLGHLRGAAAQRERLAGAGGVPGVRVALRAAGRGHRQHAGRVLPAQEHGQLHANRLRGAHLVAQVRRQQRLRRSGPLQVAPALPRDLGHERERAGARPRRLVRHLPEQRERQGPAAAAAQQARVDE